MSRTPADPNDPYPETIHRELPRQPWLEREADHAQEAVDLAAQDKETRTVHDPFTGLDVQISDRLVDRLRGKYASGPHLPNGLPEFGWRQFQATPINLEAAERIEKLEASLRQIAYGSYSTFKIETPEANAFAQICDEMQRIARDGLST